MFRFANPEYFYWLIAVPVIAVLYFWSNFLARRRMDRFGERRLVLSLVPDYSRVRPVVKFVLLELIVVLLVFMLARPQYGVRTVDNNRKGIEVAVMVDVSNSMYANDINPNRLERAKLILSKLIDHLDNDRVALGVFAGEAYPQLPMTNDYVSAKLFLESLSPNMVSCQGTNFAAAIRLAQNSFSAQSKTGKAVILITDGEDHEAGALEAAKDLAKEGIHLFVMGIGTKAGAAIPLPQGGVLTDETGAPVKTALNEETCREISAAADGVYIHIDESNQAQEEMLAALNRLQKGETASQFTEADEQFRAFAVLVLLLLTVEFFLFEAKNPLFKKIKLFKA